MNRSTLCLLALGLALAAPASAQIVRLTVQGPYVQTASGMTFPESVDDFKRVSVLQYKPDGSDISAGYLLAQPNAEIVATTYSSLSPTAANPGQTLDQGKACNVVAAGVVKAMETSYPAAQRLQANLTALTQNGAVQNGYHALYSMTVPLFMNRTQEAVKSEAYIFCYAGGKWTVEYRFTYPAAADAGPAIARFMNDLKWTFTPP